MQLLDDTLRNIGTLLYEDEHKNGWTYMEF